jgi:hypothetical protein
MYRIAACLCSGGREEVAGMMVSVAVCFLYVLNDIDFSLASKFLSVLTVSAMAIFSFLQISTFVCCSHYRAENRRYLLPYLVGHLSYNTNELIIARLSIYSITRLY